MKSFLYLKEDFIWHRQEKICGAESCGKVNHRDVQTGDMYILIKSEIEFEKLWEEQYLSSGDIALIAECGTIGVSFA